MFELPQAFSDNHRQVILKYFVSGRVALTTSEWQIALVGFNLLHQAIVLSEGTQLFFAEVYDQQVDRPFAEQYIVALLALADPTQYQPVRAHFSRQIVQRLQVLGLQRPDLPQSNLLLAYCLYFWESFAAGYAFEVEIFNDLHQSGIQFRSHNIRIRESRLSAYDLEILRLRGDIKSSLYFLQVQQGQRLRHDFYITRVYEGRVQRTYVVMLQLEAWEQIDGDTIMGLLQNVTQHFPHPVRVELNQGSVVITEYAVWKRIIRQRQGHEERQ
jgi:hypothetical protein